MKKVKVKTYHVIWIVFGIMLIQNFVFTLWQCIDPVVWARKIISWEEDTDGIYNPQSTSFCYCKDPKRWLFPLAALSIFCYIAGNVLCYLMRDVPSDFQEGKYIAMIMFNNLQVIFIGGPILLLIYENADAFLIVRYMFVNVQSLATVALIFGPKIYHLCFPTEVEALLGAAPRRGAVLSRERGMSVPVDWKDRAWTFTEKLSFGSKKMETSMQKPEEEIQKQRSPGESTMEKAEDENAEDEAVFSPLRFSTVATEVENEQEDFQDTMESRMTEIMEARGFLQAVLQEKGHSESVQSIPEAESAEAASQEVKKASRRHTVQSQSTPHKSMLRRVSDGSVLQPSAPADPFGSIRKEDL